MTDIASPSPRGYVLGADQGLASDRPGLKASAGSTGGQLTVFTVSVDGGPPRRTHTNEDESSYLFSGLLEVECDGEEFEAAPGSFVFLACRPQDRRLVPGQSGPGRVRHPPLVMAKADWGGHLVQGRQTGLLTRARIGAYD